MKKIFTLAFFCLATLFCASVVAQPTVVLPNGFAQTLLASNLDPTDMVMTPDGRIFITIKSGKVVIVQNGALLPTPLLNIETNVDNTNERGLGHIVLDPNFSTNGYFYLYFTVRETSGLNLNKNRISRYTASGNTASASTEVQLLTLNSLSGTIHNAGDMVFAPDGKLFVSTGEGAFPDNAQSPNNLLGKVLRINSDGTVPTDNPFYNNSSFVGINKAIYALGLRNPFSMDIQPGTGKLFVCDVGQSMWEEINEIEPGKNYGWPGIEGTRTTEALPTLGTYKDPLKAYSHITADGGCSIVGAAFYNPVTNQFPASYTGRFFYADYCIGWIKSVSATNGADVQTFATGVARPLVLLVTDDGSLYYIARAGLGGGDWGDNQSSSNGTLWKVNYTGSQVPTISAHPQNKTVAAGVSASFIMAANGAAPLSYQWQVNQVNISGATSSSYTVTNPQLTDSGKKYRCVVTNSFGTATTNEATLTVTPNTEPVPDFTWSLSGGGTLYEGGQQITFSGTATDAEDGTLPGENLTWKIDFHHDTHTHPALDPTTGSGGTLTIPKEGETSPNVWFRIYLTATDKGNPALSKTIYKEVFPKKTSLTLATEPAGHAVILDGQPVATPYTFESVVNITRSLSADETVNIGGVPYQFDHWSEAGKPRTFSFDAPVANTTYTATYVPAGVIPTIIDQPQSVSISEGQNVTFTVSASGTEPLSYQWQRNSVNISGATTNTLSLTNVQLAENGTTYKCVVSNVFGNTTSQEATLTVIANTEPEPSFTFSLPGGETVYRGGSTISFNGSATDAQDGTLPATSLSWRVDFHHDTHSHPIVTLNGVDHGTYTVPQTGETSANVFYRIYLTATDNGNPALSKTVFKDVYPKKINITVNSDPAGITLLLDEVEMPTPSTVQAVTGIVHSLNAPSTATVGGIPYKFDHWSEPGQTQSFIFSAPENSRTYTATFIPAGEAPVITTQPTDVSISVGGNALFYTEATGTDQDTYPLSFQWQADGVDIPDATSQLYSIFGVTLADNGKKIKCIVTNIFGSTATNEVLLSVSPNAKPVPQLTVTLSDGGLAYRGGSVISFNATASDPEEGNLAVDALTLKVDFIYGSNTIAVLSPTTGVSEGSHTVPKTDLMSPDGFYRIYVTATDHGSPVESATIYQDIFPLKSDITLTSEPAGLSLKVNNQNVITPYTFASVVNKRISLEAPKTQQLNGTDYSFDKWNESTSAQFQVDAPEENHTYTATYSAIAVGNGDGLTGYYYSNQNRTFQEPFALTRVDPVIDFTWPQEPGTGVSADHFTVRWVGEVLPRFTDTYTFHILCNDGIRLWVDNKLLINQWVDQELDWTGVVDLTAGTKYPIKIEYYDNIGNAIVQLSWSSSKQEKQIIPQTQLFAGHITGTSPEVSLINNFYPTLATDKVTVEWSGIKSQPWIIVNSVGTQVLAGQTKSSFTIQVDNLASGVYLFKAGGETIRFVKK
jgi:glucose/arabinose dehydrogenase